MTPGMRPYAAIPQLQAVLAASGLGGVPMISVHLCLNDLTGYISTHTAVDFESFFADAISQYLQTPTSIKVKHKHR